MSRKKTKKREKEKQRWATQKDNRKTALLALPAEMRNEIYRLVVTEDGHILTAFMGGWNDWFPVSALRKEPGISRASRQLREETLEMFYGLNTFSIPYFNPPSPLCVVSQPLAQHLQHLKKVVLTSYHNKQAHLYSLDLENWELTVASVETNLPLPPSLTRNTALVVGTELLQSLKASNNGPLVLNSEILNQLLYILRGPLPW